MPPKFSLQNVLDVRHGKVELLEVELGRFLTAQQEMEIRLSSLREFHTNLMEQLDHEQSDEIDLFKTNMLRTNIQRARTLIETVTRELDKRKKEAEDKRSELVKAKQAEETLEILKRKRNEIYLAEQIQVEARALDDVYIARAFRNQQQGA